ncbi:uncharacterized protein CTRU02_212089 [Colletotrichum truncatum]|uniref:Uncharacterized protein n=1 Tax=Colletotrichum truncatum TaxID=5467 RepID=A0ACC3YN18_COLTU|nr:uncharacterized protein CTRU02_06840 [Colletotrichum truncatum]KAF6792223.1 hypothetical protein CTRU02_06840 [Colletotrichum truncatum]
MCSAWVQLSYKRSRFYHFLVARSSRPKRHSLRRVSGRRGDSARQQRDREYKDALWDFGGHRYRIITLGGLSRTLMSFLALVSGTAMNELSMPLRQRGCSSRVWLAFWPSAP